MFNAKTMRSIREVTKDYNEMLKMMEGELDHENKVNVYRCDNGHDTITKDVDKGVTPFYHSCGHCSELLAKSFMYEVPQDLTPTEEWYRPTLKECLKMRKKEFGEAMLDHVLQGGLENRKIEK